MSVCHAIQHHRKNCSDLITSYFRKKKKISTIKVRVKIFTDVYKVIPPLGKEYQVVKRGKIISWLWGRIYRGKKGKGKLYCLPYIIMDVGENINWRIGEGDGNFVGRKSKLKKMGLGKNIML